MAASGKDNYLKTLESLNYICLQAIPCVQATLQTWHTNQKTMHGLQPCLQPSKCTTIKGKPSIGKGSCADCVAWATAIENVYYPPSWKNGITWQNIDPSLLFDSEIEVAKSFMIRLAHDADPKIFTDFDPASILKIMMAFGDFHDGTQHHFDVIHKVADIRNQVSHMKTRNIFEIDDAQMAQLLNDIDGLVECMTTLTHFTLSQSEHIRDELNKIRTNPVTSEMEERALQPLIAAIKPDILHKDISEIPNKVTQVLQLQLQAGHREAQQERCDIKCDITRVAEEVKVISTGVKALLNDGKSELTEQKQRIDPRSFPESLQPFRDELRAYYQGEMGQLPLLPWLDEHEMKHIDDIFVDLELVTKKVKLESYESLVTIKHPTQKDRFATRVLVLGDAGSGKTSLMSRLAYSWSQNHPGLAQFEFVFYFRMRGLHSCNDVRHCLRKGDAEMEPDIDCSLLGEILQEMPKTSVDREQLEVYIRSNPDKILILLDGWDESVLSGVDLERANVNKIEHDIENLLICKKQPSSCIIVTTRPYKSLGKAQSKYYTSVNLKGFSDGNRNKYIRKFFQDEDGDQNSAQDLIDYLNRSDDTLLSLARIPVMLMLICWMWSDPQRHSLPSQRTELYYQFVSAIWARYCDREKVCMDGDMLEDEMDAALRKIGLVAFEGLLPKEEILSFEKSRMRVSPDVGLKLGLLVEEKSISRHNLLRNVKSVVFLHKSFQEVCAAYFIVNDTDQFERFLKPLDSWVAVLSKQEVLLFCCGLSVKYPCNTAAVTIIKHAIAYCLKDGMEDNDGEIHVGRSISRGAATKFDIFPVLNLVNECTELNQEALTESFNDLLLLDELSVHNNHPETRPVFHKVVKHQFGKSLHKIKKVLFNRHPSGSLDVISDTLRRMPNLSYIYMLFKVNDNSVPSKASMTRLSESIATLSELQELRVCGARGALRGVDISVILYHLSVSPINTLTIIYFSGTYVGDAISYMGDIITPCLKWLTLNDAALQDRHIAELCVFLRNTPNLSWLEFSENMLGNSAMDELFAFIQFLPELTHLYTSAAIDSHCSPLVKQCVTAAGKDIPVEANQTSLRYENDSVIQKLLRFSNVQHQDPLNHQT